jgi:hypothetical protein
MNAPYCIAIALTNARQGKLDNGFVFGGANAYRAERITSVHEVFQSLIEEYDAASSRNDAVFCEAEAGLVGAEA